MKSTILISLGLLLAASSCLSQPPPTPTATPAPILLYSQTSFAGSTGTTPGLFDQLGLLAPEANSPRRDFYQIFTNPSSQEVRVHKATLYGNVYVPSTAVLVPVIPGTANGIPNIEVPVTDPGHVLGMAEVPVRDEEPGPIEISFSPAVAIPAGGRLAFGFIVPLADTVDANLLGTDTLTYGMSGTIPPYFTGFYISDANGSLGLAIGNHYLVIEALP
jgi:hypothetical protein